LQVLRYYRAKGKNFRNVLIVGTGEQAAKLFRDIASRPELGIRVRAFVDTQIPGSGIALKRESKAEHPRRMVPLEGFERALKRYTIDEVLFTDVVPAFSVVQELAQIAAEEGIQVSIAADIFSLEIFTSDVSYFGSTPLIHYQPYHATSFGLVFKRLFDFFVSFLLLILFAPVMILTAIAIRLETRGPIFFRQRRVGLNGRQFTLLKFRSMVEGAEEMLSDLLPHNEMSGPAFKMKRDPRVTRVGRFIRRYSIDELPQLLNVLIGDMSLVGPRPPIPAEVSHYQRRQRRRLSMRPGLTCTWQVSGRNKIPDFETWAKLDLEYIDTWSFSNDLKLLLKTIPAVFSGEGAR
jgi:exopolysaccharide biosynthesis polyprenyl glycosylphosphotransferase